MITTGTKLIRKRDRATAVVVNRWKTNYGKNMVEIRLDDEQLRAAVGGVQTGDLGWARSYWRVA